MFFGACVKMKSNSPGCIADTDEAQMKFRRMVFGLIAVVYDRSKLGRLRQLSFLQVGGPVKNQSNRRRDLLFGRCID